MSKAYQPPCTVTAAMLSLVADISRSHAPAWECIIAIKGIAW